jgi:hypothetical protein
MGRQQDVRCWNRRQRRSTSAVDRTSASRSLPDSPTYSDGECICQHRQHRRRLKKLEQRRRQQRHNQFGKRSSIMVASRSRHSATNDILATGARRLRSGTPRAQVAGHREAPSRYNASSRAKLASLAKFFHRTTSTVSSIRERPPRQIRSAKDLVCSER